MRIHFWNLAFSIFFAVLVLMASSWLLQTGKIALGITFGNFILMALAIFRLVRLFTYDHITDFIRAWFRTSPPESLLGTMGALLNCPWCTGLWFSFLVVFFAYATPLAWPVILILALAALASFIQIFSNLIGWHAEAKKLAVSREKGEPAPNTCS
ncbi:MAG TPA: DUF1360 domain-containing protein [Candidatus Paceibacterota bacterium]|nr:DUF1360 domain-containing protein [Candidatus Paceibacterota bacterium]